MLAFIPQSPPFLVHTHTPAPAPAPTPTSAAMSVAILPSAPMAYSQPAAPTLLSPSPSPSKRPKLSLNTNNVPSIFGKGSSLRLETLSATSPTTRNTFRNAYNQTLAQRTATLKPTKPTLAPLSTYVSNSDELGMQATLESAHDSAASASSASSISTNDSASEVPYKLAYSVKSILSNGPLPRTRVRRMSFTQSKPMFPASKNVSFRTPLTEDVKNERYTWKHSDIESSTSTISTLELSLPDEQGQSDNENGADESEAPLELRVNSSPKTGDKRESSDEEDSDNDSCPATPAAGRRKRHRQWVWTLGPVQTLNNQQTSHEPDKAEKLQPGTP